jgi:hypothetical protein
VAKSPSLAQPSNARGWPKRADHVGVKNARVRGALTKRKIDLLVVDEAHKLASDQRSMFFAESLGKRTRRALYVTATPFSLSVEQLCERIDDMHVVTGASREEFMKLEKDLLRFRDIVKSRGQLPVAFKQGLEGQLRRYLVRSVWEPEIAPGILRRKQVPPPAVTMLGSEGQAYTMFAL